MQLSCLSRRAHVCRAAVAFGNRMWGNEVVMNYLRTGEYRHWAPVNKVTRWTVIPALASSPWRQQSLMHWSSNTRADTCCAPGPAREARLRFLRPESLRAVPPSTFRCLFGSTCYTVCILGDLQAVHGVVPGRQRVAVLVSMQGSDWPGPGADEQGAKGPR